MADYTVIQNDSIEPDAPALSRIAFALRDNPIAIAEGAPGAPRIAGQQSPALRNGGVPDRELSADKFRTGATERDWVLARCAAASVGAVGTYAMLYAATQTSIGPGGEAAGSILSYTNVGLATTGSPSGTWRCMGFARSNQGDTDDHRTTIWLRIS